MQDTQKTLSAKVDHLVGLEPIEERKLKREALLIDKCQSRLPN
jgi:hypothetical protein